jgi:hypothetical protein
VVATCSRRTRGRGGGSASDAGTSAPGVDG